MLSACHLSTPAADIQNDYPEHDNQIQFKSDRGAKMSAADVLHAQAEAPSLESAIHDALSCVLEGSMATIAVHAMSANMAMGRAKVNKATSGMPAQQLRKATTSADGLVGSISPSTMLKTAQSPVQLPFVGQWRKLELDSNAFKFPVASISSSVTASTLLDVLEDCSAQGINLAYWSPPHPLNAAESLQWFTGFQVSEDVLLRCSLPADARLQSASTTVSNSLPRYYLVSVPSGAASRSLVELGFAASQQSRFTLDPSVSQAQLERLYEWWVHECTERKAANEVFAVYSEETNGRSNSKTGTPDMPLGFIALHLPPNCNTATVVLLAASFEHQSHGVGSLLVTAAQHWAAAAGATAMEAVIQSHDADALAALADLGFRTVSSRPVYHIWLDVKLPKVHNSLPYFTGNEARNITSMLAAENIKSGGPYSSKCQQWMEKELGASAVLLTGAGTTALEQAALLCDFKPGDEVIMPSYTFVSTANAFVMRGATPVFVDVDPDTLNITATSIAPAITTHTRAIVVVHYAGVACDMDPIMALAKQHNLIVVEDAAHAFLSTYNGRYLGTIGHFGCLSFHYTKNITCGEGGALIVNDQRFLHRAYVSWEKGTNRFDFLQGKVDKYQWLDLGSSYVPSEIAAAFLFAQLEHAHEANARRRHISASYYRLLEPLQTAGKLQLMPKEVGTGCGHIFWLMLPSEDERNKMQRVMKLQGVEAFSHYLPLHQSPGGQMWGKTAGDLPNTIAAGTRLLRLPMWPHMTCVHVHQVVKAVYEYAGVQSSCPSLQHTVRMFARKV